MRLFEMIAIVLCLICCSGGISWLLYDMHRQLKYYKAERESTLGLVEDEEDEEYEEE